jgi:hypothetical protein
MLPNFACDETGHALRFEFAAIRCEEADVDVHDYCQPAAAMAGCGRLLLQRRHPGG